MKNKKILIIEDELPLRRGLADAFAFEHFTTFEASNGIEGLALAEKEHPDFIILDLLMPKKDGIEMLKDLRNDPWGKDAKVIVWSNSKNLSKEEEARQLGVLGFWVKSEATFRDVVNRIKEKVAEKNG